MHEQWRIDRRGALPEEQKWIDENEVGTTPQIDLVLGAWLDLSGSRQVGFGGLGGIPFSEIRSWGEFYGLTHDNIVLLNRTLRYVTGARMMAEAAKRPKQKT